MRRAVLALLIAALACAEPDVPLRDTARELEEIDFHSAGVESSSELAVAQSQNDTADAAPAPSSGLAWDKHDFEVSNNKGGDVKVEVNLAAPMSTETSGGGDDEEQEDITDILKMLQPEDPVNPLELMSMMKDLMVTMKPSEPEYNITEILNEFKATLPPPPQPAPQQDLTPLISAITEVMQQRETLPAPAAPPMPNPEHIIRATMQQPAPVMQPQPFDVGSFMKEFREAMAANKPPPQPPAGVDPQLISAIKDTLAELKELRQATPLPTPAPVPTAPAPPSNTPAPTAVPQPEPIALYPPPAPPAGGSAGGSQQAEMKDMIKGMLDQIKPPTLPAFPSAAQDAALEELRAMIKAQQLQSSKPIILPPPVSQGAIIQEAPASLAPPPPPPPAASSEFKNKLEEMIKDMIPAPQRIPAPPRIEITQKQVACCSQPTPEDNRSEEERCPRINGIRPPRCKRDQPPSVTPMKCRGATCGSVDADGDINVDGPSAGSPQMPHSDFNPQKLLRALCPGGLCPDQKDIDPHHNPRLAPEKAQTGSV